MTTLTHPATAAAGRERLVWPDLAKGACILLVVLHHVIVKDYPAAVAAAYEPVEDAWRGLTFALKPVRMPLFFVVSGLFTASAVSRSWRSSGRRIVSGYYLYVLWLGVYVVVYRLEREIPANRVNGVADFFGELIWAASSMWFLYALVVYFVVAKALRGLPPALVVAAAATLSMAVSGFGIEENNRYSVLAHLVFYLVGAYYPQVLRRVADLRLRGPAVVGLALLYAAATVVVFHSGLPSSLTAFVASVIGIPLGITLAVRCVGTRIGTGLAWMGRRTLQVYVMHLAVLVALVQLPLASGETATLGLVTALGYPLAMSAVVVVGCLALHRVLVRLGLGWLFALPAVIDRRLASAAEASPRESLEQPAPALAAK